MSTTPSKGNPQKPANPAQPPKSPSPTAKPAVKPAPGKPDTSPKK